MFSADLRALAALRIALALVVLRDLLSRASDLTAHYTDAGVLPRADLFAHQNIISHWSFSLNLVSGGAFFQGLIFAVAALAAIGLLVGYATRLMTLIVWLLVVSIEWRNPLIDGGGEALLRLLLFWGLFLPLGAVWSVDRARQRTTEATATRIASVPVAALFLQIVFVYWFAVILKSGPEWRFHGTALYSALSLNQLAKPLAHTLLHYPGLLKVMTFGVLALEAFGPFLLLSPFMNARARIVGVALFASFHLGIWLTLGMGIFPAIAGSCLVCFLPTSFWDGAERIARSARARLLKHAEPPVPSFERSAPTATRASATNALRIPRAASAAVIALLLCVLWWNITTVSALRMPEPLAHVATLLAVSQRWDMFAPSPVKDDGWYVVPGVLQDGRTADLAGVMRGDERVRPVSFARPRNIRTTYRDEHWRKYLENLRHADGDQHVDLARYICRRWNGVHAGAEVVISLVILYMEDPALPNNRRARPRGRTLAVQSCA
ncbi:MAG: HTTM domain-containing protein [Actinobacteria bacterium]|nr:HTTM domain-containing protein [Actinomycetota bacterium]